jgi:hypothetical protein
MSCIPIDQLFAFTRNELSVDEAERVRIHLDAGCGVCRQQLDQLQKILAVTAKEQLLETPDWLTHQAMHLFAWHQAKPREIQIEYVPALLVGDSFAGGRLLGFRGTGLMSRQILYRAGNYDVDLSLDYIEPARTIDLMGQTMPLGGDLSAVAEADVQLLSQSLVAVDTRTNEFGEFIIEGVSQGLYDLRIKLNDQQIDIAGLNTVW